MKSVLLLLILSLTLIHSGDAARVQCADKKTVACYIRKWRPRALRSGICTAAIACVRAQMLQKVRSECYKDDELGEYMGTATPACLSMCLHLGEDDRKKSNDGGTVPVHVPVHHGEAKEPRGFFVPHDRFRNWWYTFTGHPSNIWFVTSYSGFRLFLIYALHNCFNSFNLIFCVYIITNKFYPSLSIQFQVWITVYWARLLRGKFAHINPIEVAYTAAPCCALLCSNFSPRINDFHGMPNYVQPPRLCMESAENRRNYLVFYFVLESKFTLIPPENGYYLPRRFHSTGLLPSDILQHSRYLIKAREVLLSATECSLIAKSILAQPIAVRAIVF